MVEKLYVHIWSYAGEQYQQLLEEEIAFGKQKADSLILDLRDGWGGASPNYLNILQKKVPIMTQVRRGDKNNHRLSVKTSRNACEWNKKWQRNSTYGLKQYKIGTVIRTKLRERLSAVVHSC